MPMRPLSSLTTKVRTMVRPRPASRSSEKPSATPGPPSITCISSAPADREKRSVISPPPGEPWSKAFCTSSVSTTARGMASSPGASPMAPATRMRTGRSGVVNPSSTICTSEDTMVSKSTAGDGSRARHSCTRAMEEMRRTDCPTAARASALASRRAWRRSSELTVCRLFLTRWWISWMVASLDIRSWSRWRSSDMSRSRATEPVIRSPSTSGYDLTTTHRCGPCSSSDTVERRRAKDRRMTVPSSPTSSRRRPVTAPMTPRRLRALVALGDRYSTRPSRSTTITPSPTRGSRNSPICSNRS